MQPELNLQNGLAMRRTFSDIPLQPNEAKKYNKDLEHNQTHLTKCVYDVQLNLAKIGLAESVS